MYIMCIGHKRFKNIIAILSEKDGSDPELLTVAMTLVNRVSIVIIVISTVALCNMVTVV
jgi:hypothetical protein